MSRYSTKKDLVRRGQELAGELLSGGGKGVRCGGSELSTWGAFAVDQYRSAGADAAREALKAATKSHFAKGRGEDFPAKVERVCRVLSQYIKRISKGGFGERDGAEILERIIGYALREMRCRGE